MRCYIVRVVFTEIECTKKFVFFFHENTLMLTFCESKYLIFLEVHGLIFKWKLTAHLMSEKDIKRGTRKIYIKMTT